MMTSRMHIVLGLLVALAWPAADSLAAPPEGRGKPDNVPGQGHGHGHEKGGPPGHSDMSVELAVAGITVELARQYATSYRYTGYKPLPPGIRKNLARGKPLPPGIAMQAVPADLLVRLPVHPGYEWRVCGNDLVLYAIAGAVVADVLYDVFR